MHGRLTIVDGVSRIDGTLLAIRSASDPIAAATQFVRSRGLESGDRVVANGTHGAIGETPAFFLQSIRSTGEGVRVPVEGVAFGRPGKKVAGAQPSRRTARKPKRKKAGSKPARPRGTRKAGGRKAAGRRSR